MNLFRCCCPFKTFASAKVQKKIHIHKRMRSFFTIFVNYLRISKKSSTFAAAKVFGHYFKTAI